MVSQGDIPEFDFPGLHLLYTHTQFYDAAIIHSGRKADVQIATLFFEQIEQNVRLENGEIPKLYLKERETGSPDIDKYQLSISNSNYKFVLVTKNMTNAKWFKLLKKETIMEAIVKEQSLVPVYVGKKTDYEAQFALKGINGIEIDPSGRFSFGNIRRMFNQKLERRICKESSFIKERERAIFLIKKQVERENLFLDNEEESLESLEFPEQKVGNICLIISLVHFALLCCFLSVLFLYLIKYLYYLHLQQFPGARTAKYSEGK